MGRIVHFEFMGPDGAALRDFYGDLFGWSFEAAEGFDEYFLVGAEQAGVGGAVGKAPEGMAGYHAVYVEVPSIDEALAAAEARGATTVMGRTVIPGTVVFALLSDPAGNLVGLVEPETPPAG